MTLRKFYNEVASNTSISAEDKEKDSKRAAIVALGEEILTKMEKGKKYLNSDIVAMFAGKYNASKISYVLREILKDKVTADDSFPKQYSLK